MIRLPRFSKALFAGWLLLAACPLMAQTADEISASALAEAQAGNSARAEQLWLQASKVDPSHFEANFNLGLLYSSRKAYSEAARFLELAARENPGDFNTRFLLGAAYSQLGNVDQALEHWVAAARVDSANARLQQLLAVEFSKGRYFVEASEASVKALELGGPKAELYLLAIKAHQDAQRHSKALELARQMVVRFPGNARAEFELGYELSRAGKPDEGLPHIRRAMEAPDTWEEPFYFVGEQMVRIEKYEEAIKVLERAIEIRSDYISARVMLARAHIGLGQYLKAKEVLERAVEINPQHPQPHLLLSQIYFRMGDEAAAAREKAISLELRRNDPSALEALPARQYKP